jgi:putative SOS response-associated peptidase YedK
MVYNVRANNLFWGEVRHMCGRFTITLQATELQEQLNLGDFPTDFVSRFNVAPTQPVAVVCDPLKRQVEWMKWGLIPSWAKDPAIGVKLINARSETLLEKPSFKQSFTQRRCLLVADGFYEWQKQPGRMPSLPHYFYLIDHRPFFFAGLWNEWKNPAGEQIRTCTILTTRPNEVVAAVHDRMPVILEREAAWSWLQPGQPVERLLTLLGSFPAAQMAEHRVSREVNQTVFDSSLMIAPEWGTSALF